MKNYLKIVKIDEHSITPKYLQLINSILKGIEDGKIEKDDVLRHPSMISALPLINGPTCSEKLNRTYCHSF